jgi:hypothetical protein
LKTITKMDSTTYTKRLWVLSRESAVFRLRMGAPSAE